jgi:hypothetical protein
MKIPVPFPDMAERIGLGEFSAEVVEGSGELPLDRNAVERAGFARRVGGVAELLKSGR